MEVYRKEVISQVRQANFIAVIADETTDVRVQNELSTSGFIKKRGRIDPRGAILVSWWAKICKRAKVRKGAKGGRF